MPIFRENNGTLNKVKLSSFPKEKSLQNLIEKNLFETLDLHFLASEYPTSQGGRIDTLAVDSNGAPVIIEYKLTKNENVINQSLSYLRWLKAQKVEFFEMLVMKKLDKETSNNLKIDWKNPRVICIAESYSKFDIDTVEVIPIRLELFQYRYYEGGILSLEPVNVKETSEKIETVYPPDDFISKLFQNMKDLILQIDENITERKTKYYIAFRVGKNFAEVYVQKNQIKLYLRSVNYDDPRGFVKRVPDTHQWTLNSEVCFSDKEDLEYVINLVEQSYRDVL
jgi:predicted transport protein